MYRIQRTIKNNGGVSGNVENHQFKSRKAAQLYFGVLYCAAKMEETLTPESEIFSSNFTGKGDRAFCVRNENGLVYTRLYQA